MIRFDLMLNDKPQQVLTVTSQRVEPSYVFDFQLFQFEETIFDIELFTARLYIRVFHCDLSIDFFWQFSAYRTVLEESGFDFEISLR